jgi:flagellar basal body rod protein FlgG
MDPLTAAAASGLQARMDSLDLLANNLSNTSTSGYKADREFYGTYLSVTNRWWSGIGPISHKDR